MEVSVWAVPRLRRPLVLLEPAPADAERRRRRRLVLLQPCRRVGAVIVDADDEFRVGTLKVLSEAECLALLGTQATGRIVFVDTEGQPIALPVNYVLCERTIAFRSDPGAKVTGATRQAVAFEIDGIDPLYHEGWSVVVKGTGEDITDATDAWSQKIRAEAPAPWATGDHSRWMVISDPSFSGRRIQNG